MHGNIVAVIGVSGVGKTTLVRRLVGERTNLVHVGAGSLLARARKEVRKEDLRIASQGEVEENQEIILREFNKFVLQNPNRDIVFDGHCFVDNDQGLVPVSVDVYARISPKCFVLITAPAERIIEQRSADIVRRRPLRSVDEIEKQQELAQDIVLSYSKYLKLPFFLVDSYDFDEFAKVLTASFLSGNKPN